MDDVGYGRLRMATYITVLLLVLMAGLLGGLIGFRQGGGNALCTDTVRVTVVDTVTYRQPVPVDSVVVRYVTKVLKAVEPAADATSTVVDSTLVVAESQHTGRTDSVAVEIPITQKKYETEDYTAYVSGYEPNLDSIFVYRKTITETVTPAEKPKGSLKDRFGFGLVLGAGYGTIHKQADVFVGTCLFFRIWP